MAYLYISTLIDSQFYVFKEHRRTRKANEKKDGAGDESVLAQLLLICKSSAIVTDCTYMCVL